MQLVGEVVGRVEVGREQVLFEARGGELVVQVGNARIASHQLQTHLVDFALEIVFGSRGTMKVVKQLGVLLVELFVGLVLLLERLLVVACNLQVGRLRGTKQLGALIEL